MSRLHIYYNGDKRVLKLYDGKSDLLDRYVDLNTGEMYYTMGRQISFKPINPNGIIGREIMQIALEEAGSMSDQKQNDWDDIEDIVSSTINRILVWLGKRKARLIEDRAL